MRALFAATPAASDAGLPDEHVTPPSLGGQRGGMGGSEGACAEGEDWVATPSCFVTGQEQAFFRGVAAGVEERFGDFRT